MQKTAILAATLFGGLFLTANGAVAQSFVSNQTTSASATSNVLLASTQKTTSKKVTEAAAPKPAAPAPTPTPAPVVVTVAPGDYLTKIADANGTTATRLFYANTDIANPDLIFPGQQLRVPAAEEELAARDLPTPAVTPIVPAQAAATPRASASTTSNVIASDGSVWDQIAACESGNNWAINTGNGYYGGLQFNLGSWRGVGGEGLPSDASREEQIMRGQMLQAKQGWGSWPACTAKLGIR